MGTLFDGDEHREEEVPAHLVRRAVDETRVVFAKADEAWRPFSCPASADCCQRAMTSRPPWLWPSEWAALEAFLGAEHPPRPLPPPRADGGCPFLDAGGKRCTVYAARPFGCRTFFCEKVQGPPRHPTQTTNGLLERLGALNERLEPGAAPRPLPEWIARANFPPPK